MGTQKNPDYRRAFMRGYDAMLERLKPETIIFFGKVPDECKGQIIRVKSFQNKFTEARMDTVEFA